MKEFLKSEIMFKSISQHEHKTDSNKYLIKQYEK